MSENEHELVAMKQRPTGYKFTFYTIEIMELV